MTELDPKAAACVLLRVTFYHLDALRFRLKIRYVAREDDTYLDEHSQTSTLPDAEPIAIISAVRTIFPVEAIQRFRARHQWTPI
jgi:hypothetical protein